MRRADRLFDIIQRLRTANVPVTASALATELEVTVRTVYRDIAALQARRVPIEGAPGIGYVFRRGFDLPPLMFTADEIESIAVGARLLRRTGDTGLQGAAESVLSKISVALPPDMRTHLDGASMFVSDFGATASPEVDLALVRAAIRTRRKLRITYADASGRRTRRTIWPVAIGYYVQVTLVAGWCETRRDYRHFRTDRIKSLIVLDATFDDGNGALASCWRELPKFGAEKREGAILDLSVEPRRPPS